MLTSRGSAARNAVSTRAQLAKPPRLHDGRVGATEPTSAHADHSWNGVGLQVSLQHLPTRPQEIQHALALERPVPTGDALAVRSHSVEHARPAASASSEDCAPSTSARTATGPAQRSGGDAGGKRRGEQAGSNSRDAAALTNRITRTKTVAELQEVVKRYRQKLNPIHTAAAIVKLAKLTTGAPQQQHRTSPPPQQQRQQQPQLRQQSLGVAAVNVASPSPAAATKEGQGEGATVKTADGGSSSSTSEAGLDTALWERAIPEGSGQRIGSIVPASVSEATVSGALLADLSSAFLAYAQQQQYPSARQFANVVWALGNLRSRNLATLAPSPPSPPHQHQHQPHPSPQPSPEQQRQQPQPQTQSRQAQKQPHTQHLALLTAAASQLLAGGSVKLAGALPQELSNLALGLAKLGYREVPLWAAIIAAGKQRLAAFKPQELHNMAWAVAAASQDRSMISAAVQAALPQLSGFNPSGLANLLWACATAQCHCEELFEEAAAVLMRAPPHELNSQDVANVAWAFAKLQHPHPALMRHLGGLVLRASGGSGPGAASGGRSGKALRSAATQELVSLLWAFASMPPQGLGLMDALREGGSDGGDAGGGFGLRETTAGRSGGPGASGSSRGTGLASGAPPAAAMSTSSSPSLQAERSASGNSSNGSLSAQLAAVLLPEVAKRRDLTPQGASNALWACGRMQPCPLPPAALSALLREAGACAGSMSDQELSNALWAVGELRDAGHYVPPTAVAPLFAVACCPARLEGIPPAGLAQLVSAAVKLRLVGTAHMDVLAKRVMRGLAELGPQELCVLACSVAEAVHVAKYCNPILLNGLANAAAAQMDRLDPQGLSTLLWAFARAKHYHGPLTTSICRVAAPRLREFSDMELSNLVWALAVLKCQDRQLLVRAARVLVVRVRLRRQRQLAAAAGAAGVSAMQQQRRYWAAPAGTGAGAPAEQQRRLWQRDEVLSSSAVAQRQQQQLRWQQQQQLEQQARWQEPSPSTVQVGWRSGSTDGSTAAAYQPDQAEPVGVLRADADAAHIGHAAPTNGNGAGTVASAAPAASFSLSSADDGDASIPNAPSYPVDQARTSATAGPGTQGAQLRPLPPPPPSAAVVPDTRPLLRRLPSLQHHDEADVPLQARRPPPRDASGSCGPASGTAGRLSLCDGGADGAADPSRRRRGSVPTDSFSDADDADGGSVGLGAGGAAPTAQGHAKSMAKLLWGFAKCNLYNQPLYRLLTQELRPLMHLLTPHEVVQVLWSVAFHNHSCPELLDAAAPAVVSRLGRFCPWDGSVVAWTYAKLGYPHRELFDGLQHHALRSGARYNEPCLCRLLWALAELELPVREHLLAQMHAARAQQARAYSSYDGADGEPPPPSDAGRVEPEW